MPMAFHDEVRQVVERLLGACGTDILFPYQAAQDLGDFKVQKVWRVHRF